MTRQCWLVSNGTVLASAERADSHHDKGRGLLGRDHFEGAMVLTNTRWVHSFGMRFAIDVAHLDSNGNVLRVATLVPHRLGVPVKKASTVVEAAAGAFERWGLKVGDVVELRE
ncbi:MAG: DUF192 domain-containing protein [Actinomycetota bacterium]